MSKKAKTKARNIKLKGYHPKSTIRDANAGDHPAEEPTSLIPFKLQFDERICLHHGYLDTDIRHQYDAFHDKDFFKRNNKEFLNGVPFKATQNAARQYAATIIKSCLDISFEDYYDKIKHQEDVFKQHPHYDLFMASSYYTLCSHVSTYYGFDDIFVGHRQFVQNFMSKYPVTPKPKIKKNNLYDSILYDALNNPGVNNNQVNTGKNFMLNQLCDLYEQMFLEAIKPDLLAITSFYIYLHNGQLDIDMKWTAAFNNIKRLLCKKCPPKYGYDRYQTKILGHIMDTSKYYEKKIIKIFHYNLEENKQSPLFYQFSNEESDAKYKTDIKQSKTQITSSLVRTSGSSDCVKGRVPKTLKEICLNYCETIGGHYVQNIDGFCGSKTMVRTALNLDLDTFSVCLTTFWAKLLTDELDVNFNFVYIGSKPIPVIPKVYAKIMDGDFAIITYDGNVTMVNNNGIYSVKKVKFKIGKNFLYWCDTITPNVKLKYLTSHRIMHFGNDEDYHQLVLQETFKLAFVKIGYGPTVYAHLVKLILGYFKYGYQHVAND